LCEIVVDDEEGRLAQKAGDVVEAVCKGVRLKGEVKDESLTKKESEVRTSRGRKTQIGGARLISMCALANSRVYERWKSLGSSEISDSHRSMNEAGYVCV
jgi:hypothetical protein